jgi:Mor family transcriptional regulator
MNNLQAEYDQLLKDITIEDMPSQDMMFVAEQCGIKVALDLIKKLGGVWLYIPKRNALMKIAKKIIIKNFDGTNAKQLAILCNISERQVYSIVEEEDSNRKDRLINLQTSLFNNK